MAIYLAHTNPVAPITAPTADDLHNAYQQHNQQLRGYSEQKHSDGFDPYAAPQDNQQQQQDEHAAAIQQFLSPVPVNHMDVNNEHTEEKHQAFLKNIFNDPAVKEVGDHMQDVLEALQAEMQNGLSVADAQQILAEFGQEVIEPAIQKHHGKHSPSHRTSLHDVDEPELPAVVKRAAAKGRK